MAQIFSNYAVSQTVSAISDTDTTIDITPLDGGKFRAPGANEYELLTLTDGINWEIVKCTTRVNDAFTIERGYEGVAQPWTSGTVVKSAVTRDTLDRMMQIEVYGSSVALFNYMHFR